MSVKQKPSVLIIEDSLSLARTYTEYLQDENYKITCVEKGEEALSIIKKDLPHVILLDLGLPDMNGMEILRYIKKQEIPSDVIVITAEKSVDAAVDAMRQGAFDFISKSPDANSKTVDPNRKSLDANRLKVSIKNALEHQRLSEIAHVFEDDFVRDRFCGFIGASLPMQSVYRIIESAAPSKATVFISGESGTGKELCAEAIHQLSKRRQKPFITINCAAIPKDLIESEIFGHVKGAFTGASAERMGAAKRADGGTLFLDELCEMDLDLQSKLLRFIQTGTFHKVGGNQLEKVDVRFVVATNRNVEKEVAAGRFREDLYYRLHVIPLHIPLLCERDDDIIVIARALLAEYTKEEGKRFKGFAADVEAVLRTFQWPGNVRQLQNVIRNMVVLNNDDVITRAMLPPPLDTIETPEFYEEVNKPATIESEQVVTTQAVNVQPLWKIEKQVIEEAIRRCGGNIPKAATLLDISASTIYRKRQAWGGD